MTVFLSGNSPQSAKRMVIKNRIKNTCIKNIELADSFFSRIGGLMFRGKGRMLLKFRKEDYHAVWMPFMRFSIDILFMNKENTIVDITECVVPISCNPRTWKIYSPQRKCMYVLEVESGLSRTKQFAIGDVLEIIF